MERHLPPGIPLDKVEGIYKQMLQKLSDTLIEQIHEFIKTRPATSAESAQFQVFPDEYCEGHSAVWMYFEGKNTKIDENDPTLFAGKSLEFFTDFSALPTLDLDAYSALEYPDMLVDLIVEWFAECWWKAGGWYYPIPVEIVGHEGFGHGESVQLTQKLS